MFKRKEIKEVFTPRKDTINKKMYIHRTYLEDDLKRKINGSKHIIIYGESGCGKSWLFKKVLEEEKVSYSNINLANAKRLGSITNIFKDELAKKLNFNKVEYCDVQKAEINAMVAKGNIEHQDKYHKIESDPLREYINLCNNKIIVLDNLESIFSFPVQMQELGDILTLLDDDSYKVKFLIVGVPSGVIEYFNSRDLLKTVANRLTEVPEIKGLKQEQVKEFAIRGFREELKINLNDNTIEKLSNHLYWITNGIPQKVQEYCEILAYKLKENNWHYEDKMIKDSDKTWVLDNLHKNYTLISEMMNSIKTEVGRRNQVLYCLGKINKTTFKISEIEELVRREFKKTTCDKVLNISLILNDIAEWKNSFIKKSDNEFIITDKQYILCIRIMLYKTKNDKVEKIDISQID